MTQSHQDETTPAADIAQTSTAPGQAASATTPPDAPTIGTGTSLALGCVAGTILLIAIGLIYILIVALV